MNKQIKPEFDKYAEEYTDLHQASIRASGEDPAFFAAYKTRYMAAWLGDAVRSKPLSVLDFGCGVGNTITHLREAFPSASLNGVDLSGESIRLATESHALEAEFRIIDNTNIPHENESFDVVMAACVFHHIPPAEREHSINEIRRVLKPGGHVFVFEHNMLNPLTLKTVRDCPFDEDAILLPRSELLGLVRRGNFNDVSSRYIVFFPRMLSVLRRAEPWMGWIPFGAQYVVHGIAR
ncbi:class I SAM-dependent methyltransferase [Rhodanobacter sp. L36]|uniref:class I SAM-dependent methyltransferase n=1 Tax=Rhodanobacter sp. L36 TaxID=1747221 RepID=UPI00131E4DEB|nr:class I SAM-dependent methyltransferase [Rhodanobacter sp. L36]